MRRRALSAYARESLGHYVYALRDPRTRSVFYVGKGVGNRALDHANAILGVEDAPEPLKLQTIHAIHGAGLQVEVFILQHGLKSDDHAFQTESAVFGTLRLLEDRGEQDSFSLTNLIQPPSFEEYGLMSIEDVMATYGEPADSYLIPHNSVFIKADQLWRRGMPAEELWEVTRGWWKRDLRRARRIRYVFAVPNLVIRAIWQVSPEDWREQGPGDRGWEEKLLGTAGAEHSTGRIGFDSCVEVSDAFPSLLNKSVAHTYLPGQGKRAEFVYLDDQKVRDLAKGKSPRDPFWNVDLH